MNINTYLDTENHKINSHEWRWAITIALISIIFSFLPYLVAWFATQPGWHFMGVLSGPYDAHTYLSKMRQGYDGYWLLHLKHTPEPHTGVFVYTFYLLLGHVSAWTHLPLIGVFHLARFIGGFGLLISIFQFIGHITPNKLERKLAFTFACSASGLGWLSLLLVQYMSLDFWMVEGFTPYMLFSHPHYNFALAAMLNLMQFVIWPQNYAKISGVGFSLILVMTLPFATANLLVVLILFQLWLILISRQLPYPQIKHTVLIILTTSPFLIYFYWLTKTHPIVAGWQAQNNLPAPDVLDMAVGYGLLGFWAMVGIGVIIYQQKYRSIEWLPLLWAITTLILVYAPTPLHRRFIIGLHIPIVILATIGLKRGLLDYVSKPYKSALIILHVLFGMIGTVFVWAVPTTVALQSPNTNYATTFLFIRDEELAVFDWLNHHASPDDVVLALFRLSVITPSQTQMKVFCGHGAETMNYLAKTAQVKAFFRGQVKDIPPYVNFIVYGPAERALGQPEILKQLPLVFEIGAWQIYEVPQ